jgi:NAD(P)-dependent dehydrogenase (short-subunit alcohol dehydrogenase family)
MHDLSGRVVVVTGAANGIGREMARAFSARGARLALADVDEDGLLALREELEQMGCEVLTGVVDVSVAEEMRAFCDHLYREMGRADVLCNNAGVALGGDFETMSLDDLHWLMDVNLMGVVHGCHFFYPRMVEQGGGHIVNTASAAGLSPFAGLALYSGSKYGVVGLSETLRAEAASHGIGVTVICPGVIATDIVQRSRIRSGGGRKTPEDLTAILDRVLKSRDYSPDRVAAAAVRAVERDLGVVRVTPETYVMDWIHRISRGAFDLIMSTMVRIARRIF